MKSIDYKTKYLNIRNQMVRNMKRAYVIGYTEGASDKEKELMMQEAQQGMAMGMEDEDLGTQDFDLGQAGDQKGEEFDSLIGELEGIVSKGEGESMTALAEGLEKLKMQKSEMADAYKLGSLGTTQKMAKNLKKDRLFKVGAMKNISAQGKKALSMQNKLVDEVVSKMEDGKSKAKKEIIDAILKSEEE